MRLYLVKYLNTCAVLIKSLIIEPGTACAPLRQVLFQLKILDFSKIGCEGPTDVL